MCPAPQGPLPLRRGAPSLEPGVWELNLDPAWGRNGAPGAGPGFPLCRGSDALQGRDGAGWRSQHVARGLAGKCASGCSRSERGCIIPLNPEREEGRTAPDPYTRSRGSAVSRL